MSGHHVATLSSLTFECKKENCAGRLTCGLLFPFFTAFALILSFTSAQSRGEPQPAFGGYGDGYRGTQVYCPDGQFVVGLEGRTGAWVDHFKLVCAYRGYSESGAVLRLHHVEERKFGTSEGGHETSSRCSVRDSAITAIDFNTVREDENRVINKIIITCRRIDNYNQTDFLSFGEDDGVGNLQSYCPVPQYAIGIWGMINYAGYPGRLGLVCARRED